METEKVRRRYAAACVYASTAIKWYATIAPTDRAPYAFIDEVLIWSSGGKATWESVQTLASIVRGRLATLESTLREVGNPSYGAMAAAAEALRTMLLLVDTPEASVLAATWSGLQKTKETMGAFFKNGVVQGADNFLRKSGF